MSEMKYIEKQIIIAGKESLNFSGLMMISIETFDNEIWKLNLAKSLHFCSILLDLVIRSEWIDVSFYPISLIKAIICETISISRLKSAGENFYLARGIVHEAEPGQVVCYADYAYGSDATIVQMIEYFNGIHQRVPYVIRIMTKFIAKLKEFNLIKSADQIVTSGNFVLDKI